MRARRELDPSITQMQLDAQLRAATAPRPPPQPLPPLDPSVDPAYFPKVDNEGTRAAAALDNNPLFLGQMPEGSVPWTDPVRPGSRPVPSSPPSSALSSALSSAPVADSSPAGGGNAYPDPDTAAYRPDSQGRNPSDEMASEGTIPASEEEESMSHLDANDLDNLADLQQEGEIQNPMGQDFRGLAAERRAQAQGAPEVTLPAAEEVEEESEEDAEGVTDDEQSFWENAA